MLAKKEKVIEMAQDEALVYKKQIDKLMQELEDKSDSESFEDDK